MKAYLLLCSILCCVFPLNAQLSLQDSLVAWYPFDGDALDYSGNANHGTLGGAVLTTDRFGNASSAFSFNGNSNFISMANNQKFRPNAPITITAWVLIDDFGNNVAFNNDFTFGTHRGFWLNIVNGNLYISYGDGGAANSSHRRSIGGITVFQTGQWYHVTGIIRGQNDMKLYINGKRECGTYSGFGGVLNYSPNPGISGRGVSPSSYYNGKIDEIRFYNRALDKSEIRILADFPPQDSILCLGDSLQLDAGYGNLISWNPPFGLSCTTCSDPIATPNVSTIYTAITANTPGCLDTVIIDLTVDPCDSCDLSLLLLGQNDIDCFGNNNGSINLSASNGAGPYTYSIDGAVFTADSVFTNLTAGTYAITMLDADSCFIDTSFTLSQPLQLTSNPSVNNISCFGNNDGSVSMTTTGGAPPYQYSINGGILQANPTFSNLSVGIYTILTEDINGCNSSTNIGITEPSLLSLDSLQITNPTCFNSNDGQVIAFGSGGMLSYNWSLNGSIPQANANFSQLGVGSYNIILIDANGCVDSASLTLSSPPAIQANILVDSVSCNGGLDGSISITANGGLGTLLYSLNNGASQVNNVFTNLSAGIYQVSVTDSLACMLDQIISVSEPSALLINILGQTGINCLGDSTATISVQGNGGISPYLFKLNSGTYQSGSSFFGLDSGVYTIFVQDANACEDSMQTSIGPYQAVNAQVQIISNYNGNDISCFGRNDGRVQVSAIGGTAPYNYSWSNGMTISTADSLAAGQHMVWVYDAAGCSDSTIFTLTQPDLLSTSGNILSDYNGFPISCFGAQDGAITFSATGGISPYQYNWANGANTDSQSNLTAGNYSASIVDANGCIIQTDTIVLTEPSDIRLDFVIDSTNCFESTDGSILSTPTGGLLPYQYNWSSVGFSNNPLLANIGSGTYQLSVLDANNCQQDSTVFLYSPEPIQILTDELIAPNCGDDNGLIAVIASGGKGSDYSYYWGPPLNISGPQAATLQAGLYQVEVTDAKGCTAVQSFNLQTIFFPIADFDLAATDTSRFTLSEANISVSNLSQNAQVFQWEWGDGNISTTFNPSHQYLNEGVYTIILTAYDLSLNCLDRDSITIEIIPDGSIYIPNAFTPNSDGHNDQFLILGEGIVNLEIVIYNRWGIEVFRQQAYPISWDGTDQQNRVLPEGVYTYKLQARLNDNSFLERAGTITLIR